MMAHVWPLAYDMTKFETGTLRTAERRTSSPDVRLDPGKGRQTGGKCPMVVKLLKIFESRFCYTLVYEFIGRHINDCLNFEREAIALVNRCG